MINKLFESFFMTPEAQLLVGDCSECRTPKYQWTKFLDEWTCPKCKSTLRFSELENTPNIEEDLVSEEFQDDINEEEFEDTISEDDDLELGTTSEEDSLEFEDTENDDLLFTDLDVNDDSISLYKEGYFSRRIDIEKDIEKEGEEDNHGN